MANCIKCGVWYCECPTPGLCDACLAAAQPTAPGSTPNCDFTRAILIEWNDKLNCTRNNGTGAELGLTDKDLNIHLSYVQSALNNANNLCYFASKLEETRSIIQLIILGGKCS